jgi:two-component system, cell cycle sensor histidine kinase and response regulator CckA
MCAVLRILILEDHAPDAEIVTTKLRSSGFDPEWKHVMNERDFVSTLPEGWDLILADFALPQFNALRALAILREQDSTIPLIVVTGAVGEEVAVECIKQGAADYLLKDRLSRLPSAVRQALEQKRLREESAAAHLALQEKEQRFHTLIDNGSNSTLLLNRAGEVIHSYNDLFAGGPYACRNFLEWMVEDDRAGVRQMWERLPDAIQTVQFRISSGDMRWLEAVCNDLSETPCVQAIVVHYRDVTERHELEDQLRQSQKMEAVGQLAAGLGHDLNNLLTIIGGYSDLSKRHQGLPEQVQKGLSEIQDACKRATRLTRELLAFSRKRDSKPRALDCNRSLQELAPLLKSLLREDIAMQFNLQEGLSLVEVDEGDLGQIVMNLVINARDAMPGSGTLTIETRDTSSVASSVGDGCERNGCERNRSERNRSERDGCERDGCERNGSERNGCERNGCGPQVMLAIRDTGSGMSPEVQRRIFEPFFTTKDVGRGTGLGLSTVYAIVTNASGHLALESKVGEGSTFRVFFPRAEGLLESEAAIPARLSQGVARETILLVEDDNGVRDLIDAILRPQGYRIIAACNGAAAMEAWNSTREPIDLLLTDIRMPGVKGTELARILRAKRPDLKVLFISGHTGMEAAHEQESLEGACLLAKPFSVETLCQKVREVIGAGRSVETPPQESVLIVDDDAKVRHLLRSVLEAGGYKVQDTSEGKEALSRIKRNCPDIVLTDIFMPDVDGIELIRMMRQVTRDLSIVAMSGGSDAYLQAASLLGAEATIQKPIQIDALMALMHSISGSRATRVAGHEDTVASPAVK